MALTWIIDNGRDVKTNFARVSLSDTLLVERFYSPFVQAIEDFFSNTPFVKNYEYIINWRLDGGVRSVEKQVSLSPSATGAGAGRSAHNYGMAIDFAPVGLENNRRTSTYQQVFIGAPYTRHPGPLAEPWAVAVQALYDHPTLLSGATFSNLNDYNHIEWRDYRNLARGIAPQYWRGVGPGNRQSYTAPQRLAAPVSTPRGPGISPFIAANESFHPHIQYELTRRRSASETANTYMPFVKLTSLVKVYNANLQTGEPSGSFGAYCPSLGVHGEKQVDFDSIYYPVDGRSIVGYATKETDTGLKTVPVVVESNDEDPPNIPPPGIVSVSSERNTAGGFGIRGGLFRATINIRAYSLGQTNTLLKYFIRQGTRVVLEIGRNSSSPAENILMFDNSSELTTFRSSGLGEDFPPSTAVKELFQKFDWIRPQREIDAELGPLIRLETGQKEFIERYTYNNFGNYEVLIGYVASFKMKYTKDNVYDIELTIHSVQQFEVPLKLGGTRSAPTTVTTVANPCEPIDIMEYFNPDAAYRENSFTRVLAKCTNTTEALNQTWGAHVIPLRAAGAQAGSGGSTSNGYLLSWECFVDLILNDPTYGFLGTFQLQQGLDNTTLSTLRSGVLSRIGSTAIGNPNHINSNEVSWNAQLRSTDINTMIIYNRVAQSSTRQDYATEVLSALRGIGNIPEEELDKITSGVNDNTIRTAIENNTQVPPFNDIGRNTSYLTNGVWINSNAIVQAFSRVDTISGGITELLNMMNNATQGYWNLQLLSAEPEAIGLRAIDAGLSKPIDKPLAPSEGDFFSTLPTDSPTNLINRFKSDVRFFANADGTPSYLYMFNRKLQRFTADDIGSELLDVNIDYSMPNVIAIQVIAGVGGVAQRGTLSAINVDELKAISMFDTYPSNTTPANSTCADAPSAYADKNKNNTLSVTQMGDIVAAISAPQAFTRRGGLEGVIETIETKAFEEWKEKNDAKQESERETEDAGRQKIKEDIESARQIPIDFIESRNPNLIGLVRSYASTYGNAIDLVENDISKFVNLLDKTKKDNEIHPFNASNLTKTIVDITIPGIGGILLFQAFTIDRVPNILKRGYYIVTKVNHEFAVDTGWITKIQGRFRFKPDMTGNTQS
jgi:hypothetical protein